ncbi:MAG: NAD-dependent epimerase/dehydratase family protein [Henriciella sp.]|nr:NAD-dependent epimerase/dehydratase family protein [Henriciella sp.]
MNILVLGIGGQIGNAIAGRLVAECDLVLCVSRSTRSDTRDGLVFEAGDRSDAASIAQLIARYKIDVIVDVAAYSVLDTEKLIRQLDGTIAHYVLLSSSDVYRQYGLLHRTERGRPEQGLLTETSPLRTRLYPYRAAEPRSPTDPLKWMDDYDKIPIESAVQGLQTPSTILRLPMVFGPGDQQDRFGWAIQPMLAGVERLDLPTNWLNWTTTYGYVENVAATVSTVLKDRRAAPGTFNLVDFQPRSHRDWVGLIAQVVGWGGQVEDVKDDDHPISKATAGLDLSVPLRISGDKLRAETGFRPVVTPSEALSATVSALRSAP